MHSLTLNARLDFAGIDRHVVVGNAQLPRRRLQPRAPIAKRIEERIDPQFRIGGDDLRPLERARVLRMRVQQQQHVRRGRKIELKLVTDA